MPKLPIILIGPMSTGKSTIAQSLAEKTGIRQVPLDRLRWYYFFSDGYSLEKERSIASFTDTMTYWKPFEANSVCRIVSEFPDSIIDFGAGHSYYEDSRLFEQVRSVLEPIENIVLLLPSDDKEESLNICNQRLQQRVKRELDVTETDANRDFIYNASNYELAKYVVYTKGKTVDETAEEILGLIS